MKKSLSFLLTLATLVGVNSLSNFTQAETLESLEGSSTKPSTQQSIQTTDDGESFPEEFTQTESIQEKFWRAYTTNSGDFFRSVSIPNQFNIILGFDQFPENQIEKDASILGILTKDYLQHITISEPLRTRNLPNPYQESILTNPSYIQPLTP